MKISKRDRGLAAALLRVIVDDAYRAVSVEVLSSLADSFENDIDGGNIGLLARAVRIVDEKKADGIGDDQPI